ncbi:short-chain dehydrogenase [Sphaerisporangium melleum]|uniref:Short-chain dehydrogenase n=1 Tax=Sphaerisporangium melleum TaxID=321316 RepID=A0A917VUG2_9ACTN|nr:SDR family oxidoreductase [Sphaerisporangium melleum]GGL15668.1 short-chain dehydrogenase [Sphaerisporangium melleum]GII69656.1 short-chain dehydrogenase [Sphaerisporangium melleum]
MRLDNAVAVVTGGNRGLGRAFVTQLIERGAKVYAAARDPEKVDVPGAVPLRLDITDPASVEQAAKVAADATFLINNAGISTGSSLLTGDLANIRLEMETHFFGTLSAVRAFAPVIESNGGGAILNICSVLSWVHLPRTGAYSAAKAAEWAMTNALRGELASQGVQVSSLHVGYIDTDMAAHLDVEKVTAESVATAGLDGVLAGTTEIVVDEVTRNVKANLANPAA